MLVQRKLRSLFTRLYISSVYLHLISNLVRITNITCSILLDNFTYVLGLTIAYVRPCRSKLSRPSEQCTRKSATMPRIFGSPSS